jgi:hypothetical protein
MFETNVTTQKSSVIIKNADPANQRLMKNKARKNRKKMLNLIQDENQGIYFQPK